MPGPIRCLMCVALGVLVLSRPAAAEDGYELWLRYPMVTNAALLAQYRSAVTGLLAAGDSATARASRDEVTRGLRGLLGIDVPLVPQVTRHGVIVAGTPASSPIVAASIPRQDLTQAGAEGYVTLEGHRHRTLRGDSRLPRHPGAGGALVA